MWVNVIKILIFLLLISTPVWATYITRPEMVQITTNNSMTTIAIAAGGRVVLTIKQAGSVTFAWDANTEEVDGYYLYCSGQVDIKQETSETQVTIIMQPGEYKCWATAFKDGVESGPSKNISVTLTEIKQ